MDSTGAQFVGSSCGQHGPYTFYKAFKYFKNKKPKILSLGEFFFVEILRDAPVSIGELQLLWQDKNSNQLLTSVRLYFLPEHTPDGKLDYHGEDEILALSEKLILRLDDLVTLITENVPWQQGLTAVYSAGVCSDGANNESLVEAFKSNNCGLQFSDVIKEKKLIGDIGPREDLLQVVIMSYPQYCRYRTILKRLETVTDKWLKNAIVSAIGGFSVKSRNCKIMFCKDTFYHPELEEFELRMDHLAPNLKGRPRKKKTMKRECSQDSDSYEDGSDTSSLASVSQNSSASSTRPRRRSSQNGFTWEKGNGKASKEEQMFMSSLRKFMKERQTPIDRVPSLGFKQIDLYYFYTLAKKLGGYDVITEKRLWKQLYDKLGGHPGSTSAATCTRRHYEKLLLAFERYEKGSEQKNKVKSRVKAMITGHRGQDKSRNKSDLEEKKDLLIQAIDVSVEEKVRKWNEIRKQKAIERDQLKKGPVRQTVKKMLDKVSSKENKSQESIIELPKELKIQISKVASIENKVQLQPKPVQIAPSLPQKPKTKLEVPSVKTRTRPSILSPLVQRKIQNHVKSQSPQHTTSISQHASVHQAPPPLASPVISTHALYYASNFPLPASHFIAHPSSSSVDVTSHASEKNHPHFPKSSLFVTHNASQVNENQSKQVIPSLRPSVIQHTPKPKVEDAVKYLSSTNSRSQSPSTYSSKSVIPGPTNSVPAHSNHLKRAYPYSNSLPQKSALVLNSLPLKARDSPKAHLNPVLANDPFFSNVKRVRTEPPSSHRAPMHSSITKPSDSDQDQPFDLSMKTMRAKDSKPEPRREIISEAKDFTPKTFKCALFPQEFPTSASRANLSKEGERSRSVPGSRSVSRASPLPLMRSHDHGSVSPASTGSRSATSTPLNNNKLSAKPVSSASAPYCEVISPNLHPAFPAPYMPSQISPNNVVPSPVHLQQIYAAQYANIQMAAYEDLMRQQVITQVGAPSPILLSPTQLFPNVYKDSQKFSASKS